jgi:leucyl aminopeptidase
MAKLADELPAGTYRLATASRARAARLADRAVPVHPLPREKEPQGPRVLLTKDAKAIEPALAEARAVALVRDLVNTRPRTWARPRSRPRPRSWPRRTGRSWR